MMRIPARHMPSIASVRVPLEDGSGHRAYSEPRVISRVRYERSSAARPTEYQLQDCPSGLLFVDAVTSVGAFAIPPGSLVSVDGGPEGCVMSCRELMGPDGRVHHWEVSL